MQFLVGTAIVLAATWLYSTQDSSASPAPSVYIDGLEKPAILLPSNEKDMSIPIPKTPLADEGGMATSRPGSPNPHKKRKNEVGYFTKTRE